MIPAVLKAEKQVRRAKFCAADCYRTLPSSSHSTRASDSVCSRVFEAGCRASVPAVGVIAYSAQTALKTPS
jgi:hypothetical protein